MVDILCIGCDQRMEPHMPDNQTLMPVCQNCWAALSTVERVNVATAYRTADIWADVANAVMNGVGEAAEAIAAVRLSQRMDKPFGEN